MSIGAINFENQLRIPANVFDLQGFRAWAHSEEFPQTGKISYIDREIEIDMSPEELNSHTRIKRDVSAALYLLVQQADLGETFFDGAFLVNESADLATEPDFMFCTWDSMDSGRVEFAPSVEGSERLVEVRGAPDLVCEFVSKSSVRKDTVHLRKAYYDAGIPEYWLIDARGSAVRFQILSRGRSGYVAIRPDASGFSRSPILRRRFSIIRRKNRAGGASYQLLQK